MTGATVGPETLDVELEHSRLQDALARTWKTERGLWGGRDWNSEWDVRTYS